MNKLTKSTVRSTVLAGMLGASTHCSCNGNVHIRICTAKLHHLLEVLSQHQAAHLLRDNVSRLQIHEQVLHVRQQQIQTVDLAHVA